MNGQQEGFSSPDEPNIGAEDGQTGQDEAQYGAAELTRVGILGSPAVNKGRSEERAGCVEKGKTSWYSGWLFMWVAAQPTQPAGLC